MDPVALFWNDAKGTLFCSYDEFVDMMRDVTFLTWGDVAAMSVTGNEVHLVSTGNGWLTRRAIREKFVPLLRERGYLTTRIRKTAVDAIRFAERVGFKKTGEDSLDCFFKLERIHHG